jgi:hypothetical protein
MIRSLARLAVLLALCGPARAVEAEDLYTAQILVTGQGDENRQRGFATCLQRVLVKMSGDPRIVDAPVVRARLPRAASLVREFSYRDLMAGLPVHDEQGTRDRPYELTVRFAPGEIDKLLREAGRSAWKTSRPRIAVAVRVEMGGTRFWLTRDGEKGRDHRSALAAAAAQLGLPIVLPDQAMLPGLEAAGRPDVAIRSLGDVVLMGDLVWSDQARGWTATWRLHAPDQSRRWQVRGVNFDEAFRNAMRGTLQTLSGHGDPARRDPVRGDPKRVRTP